jgi:uncharacterized protein
LRSRIAVIDSSPLINLVHLDLARRLDSLFGLIYVPSTVQSEVNRKSRFRYRLNKLYRTGLFQRCKSADSAQIWMLVEEIHPGEAEALVQAKEKNADRLILDEKLARTIGDAQGLTSVGTLRIIARLHLQGEAGETETLAEKLRRDLGFRFTDEIVRQAVAKANEPI